MTDKSQKLEPRSGKFRCGSNQLRAICLILVATASVIAPLAYLRVTGFCFDERRYLSEREMIDRFLINEPWKAKTEEEFLVLNQRIANLTPQERAALTQKNFDLTIGCCRMVDRTRPFHNIKTFVSSLISGHDYEFVSHLPDLYPISDAPPYRKTRFLMSACGGDIHVIGSAPEQEKHYNANQNYIRQYWNEKGTSNAGNQWQSKGSE